MAILIIAIVIGTVTLLTAYAAGVLESRIGSIVTSAIILLIVVGAVPSAAFMIGSATGWLLCGYLSILVGEFYHRLLRTPNRQLSAQVGGYRRWFGYRSDSVVFAVAW